MDFLKSAILNYFLLDKFSQEYISRIQGRRINKEKIRNSLKNYIRILNFEFVTYTYQNTN